MVYYYIIQVQHNAYIMIGAPQDGAYPVVAVNDTKEERSRSVVAGDADTGETLFPALFYIPENGKTVIGKIPEKHRQSIWLVDYTIGKEKSTNHYLGGEAPFKINDYKCWFKKLNIKRIES